MFSRKPSESNLHVWSSVGRVQSQKGETAYISSNQLHRVVFARHC